MYATTDEIIRAVREWQEARTSMSRTWSAKRLRALRLPPEEEAK